jgi:hypothetical protein
MLETASGEALPILKEALVELTPGRNPIHTWVLVAEIKHELILGLDILRIYNAFVDFGRHLLQLEGEE